MSASVLSLPWLPLPPEDFSSRCRAVAAEDVLAGPVLQHLATFRLSAKHSLSLSRALKRCLDGGAPLAPLSKFRVGVLASATFDLLLDCIPAAAARHGVALEVITTPYNQVMQQALDPESPINTTKLDAVLLAVDHRWMNLDRPYLSDGKPPAPAAAVQQLRAIVEALRTHGGAPAILQTVPVFHQVSFGSYDRRVRGTLRAMIEDVNRGIVSLAEETGSYLLDVASLAERVGTDLWFDPVQWAGYKLPFSANCFPIYADFLGRLLGAVRGKSRKCLVLDLDNTIWGGVIGDDGLEGIQLGQGTPLGEAFLSTQQLALDVRERGIILAVCSKNDDTVARSAFRNHTEMLLREEHIGVFQANWVDKPSNLEAIARKLNIGLDALVLLDDNPAERAQVRAALPMVAVPELPDDPAWFAWTLNAGGYFEAVGYAAEDRLRAAAYAADAQRTEVMAKARDLGDYLTSLGMVIKFSPFDGKGRQRIAQLINKTNQFNLTTRRYTESEVAAMEADDSVFTLQVRLEDSFGDLGMIAVVICRSSESGERAWEIDTWLMSCRVLGRQVEEAMLMKIAEAARNSGVQRLIGTYIPTAKNDMVKGHYVKLGFQPVHESPAGGRFELTVAAIPTREVPFKTVDLFLEPKMEAIPLAGC
jgi:FkbH-like protein